MATSIRGWLENGAHGASAVVSLNDVFHVDLFFKVCIEFVRTSLLFYASVCLTMRYAGSQLSEQGSNPHLLP